MLYLVMMMLLLEKFSRDMFRSFKGSDINSVEAAFENQTIRYRNEVSNKVFNMGGMNDPDVQEIAKAISNGAKLKDNIYFKDGRVVKLSQIKSENRDTFRLALNISKGADDVFRQIYDDAKNVGFVLPTRLKKYFRRVYDLNYISQNEDQFIDDVAKAISAQAKRDGKTISNPKKSARNIFTAITKNEFGEIVTPNRGTGRIAAGKLRLPLSESLAYERKLVGDYDLIDGPLSKYFVNDISAVINDTVQKSYKSIEFARVYGTKGQRLKFVLDDLEQQYKNSGFSKVMERDKLSAPHRDDLKNIQRHQKGGLSGKPIEQKSNLLINKFFKLLNGRIKIIGVGGIDSGKSAHDKFLSGADYIQLYTGMVFQGPNIAANIKKDLKELLLRDGVKNISEIVGNKTLS